MVVVMTKVMASHHDDVGQQVEANEYHAPNHELAHETSTEGHEKETQHCFGETAPQTLQQLQVTPWSPLWCTEQRNHASTCLMIAAAASQNRCSAQSEAIA